MSSSTGSWFNLLFGCGTWWNIVHPVCFVGPGTSLVSTTIFFRNAVQKPLGMTVLAVTMFIRVLRRRLMMMLLLRTIPPTNRMLLRLNHIIIMVIAQLIPLNLLIQQRLPTRILDHRTAP